MEATEKIMMVACTMEMNELLLQLLFCCIRKEVTSKKKSSSYFFYYSHTFLFSLLWWTRQWLSGRWKLFLSVSRWYFWFFISFAGLFFRGSDSLGIFLGLINWVVFWASHYMGLSSGCLVKEVQTSHFLARAYLLSAQSF